MVSLAILEEYMSIVLRAIVHANVVSMKLPTMCKHGYMVFVPLAVDCINAFRT